MLTKVLLAGAFAAAAAAQSVSSVLFFTRVPNPITAGTATAITYSTNDTTSPVTIILRKGASGNLQTVSTLTSSASGGQYIWTPSMSLENAADYALQIEQGTQLNYFGPFSIQGGGAATSSSSATLSSYSTASMTPSASLNGTMTSAPATMGTGNSMTRNATMTKATLSTSSRTTSMASASTSDSGAGFQTSPAAPSSTNAAAALTSGSSAIVLIFGAVAAVLFC